MGKINSTAYVKLFSLFIWVTGLDNFPKIESTNKSVSWQHQSGVAGEVAELVGSGEGVGAELAGVGAQGHRVALHAGGQQVRQQQAVAALAEEEEQEDDAHAPVDGLQHRQHRVPPHLGLLPVQEEGGALTQKTN